MYFCSYFTEDQIYVLYDAAVVFADGQYMNISDMVMMALHGIEWHVSYIGGFIYCAF